MIDMVPNSMWEQGARRASGGLSGLWSISRGSYSRSACHVVGFCHFGVKRIKWQQLYRNTVMENRPVDPGSIQRSHRPLSFIRIKHRTRANDILCKTESYRTFSPQKPYYTNVSDVPRSLQSLVSTIQTVVLTADVCQLFIKKV